jgi:hypothetical protein
LPDGFESAYAYARICGSLARSYLGERASALAASHRVGEVWRAIFGEPPPALPEAELAAAAELGVKSRPLVALRSVLGSLALSDPFFAALSRKWEYAYLKEVLAAASASSPELPPVSDPGLEPGFDSDGYPDLDRMLRKTRYRWVIESGLDSLPTVKNALDRQYYAELWEAAKAIPVGLAGSIPDLLRVEAELENLSWGLRLKRYYSLGAADVEGLLIELRGIDVRAATLRALGFRADARSEWVGWKWERLVPDSRREDGGDWYFDVRGFESAAGTYLYRRLFRCLHMENETYVPAYAYFRIKEFESTAIRGIIEGIKLEAPAAEIAAIAAETTGGRC